MISGLEGIPGSGKSYEATTYHVLEALKQGRKVITNLPLVVDKIAAIDPSYRALIEIRIRPAPIRGTFDAARVDDAGNGNAFELFEDGRTEPAPASVRTFGHVWDYWSDWRHPTTGRGPLFVVDECHVALPKIGTPEDLVGWFKLHRHFNADVLLMTQSFRDMNQPIAGLQEVLVKCRKASVLGKPKEYIRKVHAGYRGGLVSEGRRPYKAQFFGLYKSHTQGLSVAEAGHMDMSSTYAKFRKFTIAFWIVTVPVVAWAFWPKDKPAKPASPPPVVQHRHPVPQTPPVQAASAPVAAISAPQAPEAYPEPYAAHGLHVTGHLRNATRTLYTFSVAQGAAVVATVTSDDLQRAGYTVTGLTECVVVLQFGQRKRSIVCDAPTSTLFAQGTGKGGG